MPETISEKLCVGISSRALFDLSDSNAVYETQGVDAYSRYQIAHENEILKPGVAFPLVKKFLRLDQSSDLIEIILLSRNSADTGLRIFNSIAHYGLNITRAVFTSGESPYHYMQPFALDLFLSTHQADVEAALQAGCAAAMIWPSSNETDNPNELNIAFDGDSVLFTDESERIFKTQGIDAFNHNESEKADEPLAGGPFQGFLKALHKLQQHFPEDACPIRTALVTARQAPAHERVIRTLRSWNIRIDQALFLGGLDKATFLEAFKADIFFDDQHSNCQSASQKVTTGHVPHGVANNERKNP